MSSSALASVVSDEIRVKNEPACVDPDSLIRNKRDYRRNRKEPTKMDGVRVKKEPESTSNKKNEPPSSDQVCVSSNESVNAVQEIK